MDCTGYIGGFCWFKTESAQDIAVAKPSSIYCVSEKVGGKLRIEIWYRAGMASACCPMARRLRRGTYFASINPSRGRSIPGKKKPRLAGLAFQSEMEEWRLCGDLPLCFSRRGAVTHIPAIWRRLLGRCAPGEAGCGVGRLLSRFPAY